MSVRTANEPVRTILRATRKAAVAFERVDLVRRIDQSIDRLDRPDAAVVVLGEFKQGKSSLINALVGRVVCPVDDDVATATVTVVHHAERSQAVAFLPEPGAPERIDRRQLSLDEVGSIVLSGAITECGAERPVRALELGIPTKLLASGLRLVDTPGVGGMDSAHGEAALGIVPLAEAVLFVTDASEELTSSEIEALRVASARCPHVLCVVSKIDVHHQWRVIAERNREHLQAHEIDCPVLPVSSALRTLAIEHNDRSLNDESGFAALLEILRDDVVGCADERRVTMALHDAEQVVKQLAVATRAERSALSDAQSHRSALDAARAAELRAGELRTAAARWSTTLADGINDLQAGAEHDLRLRMRLLLDESSTMLDQNDPTDVIAELVPEIGRRLLAEIHANHDLIRTAAVELAGTVAEVFAAELPPLHAVANLDASGLSEDVEALEITLDDRPGALASALTALRGSYGGMMMFGGLVGIAGNVVSAAALGPAGLLVGAALGRRATAEERRRQVDARRRQAKQALKKHVDEFQFRALKHGRDTIRAIQRELRDTHLVRAKEIGTTANEAARAARSAAEATERERCDRLRTLERRAEGLERIHAAIHDVQSAIRFGADPGTVGQDPPRAAAAAASGVVQRC